MWEVTITMYCTSYVLQSEAYLSARPSNLEDRIRDLASIEARENAFPSQSIAMVVLRMSMPAYMDIRIHICTRADPRVAHAEKRYVGMIFKDDPGKQSRKT